MGRTVTFTEFTSKFYTSICLALIMEVNFKSDLPYQLRKVSAWKIWEIEVSKMSNAIVCFPF